MVRWYGAPVPRRALSALSAFTSCSSGCGTQKTTGTVAGTTQIQGQAHSQAHSLSCKVANGKHQHTHSQCTAQCNAAFIDDMPGMQTLRPQGLRPQSTNLYTIKQRKCSSSITHPQVEVQGGLPLLQLLRQECALEAEVHGTLQARIAVQQLLGGQAAQRLLHILQGFGM